MILVSVLSNLSVFLKTNQRGCFMDKFIIFSTFILILSLLMVFFSLVIKSVPKLKMRDAAPYLDKISAIKDCVNVAPAGEEDMEKIKRTIQHSIGILTVTIFIDILAIAGLISIVREERIAAGYIAVYIVVLAALSAVCLYKGIKHMQVFRDSGDFNKRNGVLLKYKEMRFSNRTYRSVLKYQVLIGTYDDEENPIVFRTTIPDFVFRAVQKNDKWSVVMYQGRPAGIIKG